MTPRRIAGLAAALLCTAITLTTAPPVLAADKISDGQWYVDYLRLDQAHQITKGEGAVLALIDSGVDATHPDLRGSIHEGPVVTWDDTDQSSLRDTGGHGTAMAGLIVGQGRVQGIAPQAELFSIKTVRGAGVGSGSPDFIAAGVRWAVDIARADVISISLYSPESSPLLDQALEHARQKDVVVVAGAGNTSSAKHIGYPAKHPLVLAVGAVDKDGEHASFSVIDDKIEIVAPGDKTSSTWLNHSWQTESGTSDATAIVAGAAALIRAKYPDMPAREVIHRLTATADDKGPEGRDPQYGHGVLDIVAALTADVPPLPATTPTVAAASPTNGPAPTGWHLSPILYTGAGLILVAGALGLSYLSSRRRRRR